MFRLIRKKKGQSTAEYAILIGIVIAAAVGVQTYVKRGIQAKFKTEVDSFVAASEGSGLDPTTLTLDQTQFEDGTYMARTSQDGNTTSTSDLWGTGRVNRTSTTTGMHIGTDGDYRIYDAP